MSGKSLLLDSNIIIRLSKQDPILVDFVNKSSQTFISIITHIIAATALVCHCDLVTANVDDFKLISKLNLIGK
jgi:predicted nucleic acid-binding protein